MLKKDILREIKSAKSIDIFNRELNSRWTGFQPPSQFASIVTQCIIASVPHLAPILNASPITNGTANAVASALERC